MGYLKIASLYTFNFNLRSFIFKSLFLTLIVLAAILIKIVAANFDVISKTSLKYMPLNNVSNSNCFRAKVDHLTSSDKFKRCTFLIAGSSMSLNNISGKIISNRLNKNVYNISSWGLKPDQISDIISVIKNNQINCILLAFNNCDFGTDYSEIDYSALKTTIDGNQLQKSYAFLNTLNINTFSADWKYRYHFSQISNHYESLNFDEFGSVLLTEQNFKIDASRWRHNQGAGNLNFFYKALKKLDSTCKRNNIKLILAYLPSRPGLLTENNIVENRNISKVFKHDMGSTFIDLQQVNLSSNQFCDAYHLFKSGAENITNTLVDSLIRKEEHYISINVKNKS